MALDESSLLSHAAVKLRAKCHGSKIPASGKCSFRIWIEIIYPRGVQAKGICVVLKKLRIFLSQRAASPFHRFSFISIIMAVKSCVSISAICSWEKLHMPVAHITPMPKV